jgi:hypothetical protein
LAAGHSSCGVVTPSALLCIVRSIRAEHAACQQLAGRLRPPSVSRYPQTAAGFPSHA